MRLKKCQKKIKLFYIKNILKNNYIYNKKSLFNEY